MKTPELASRQINNNEDVIEWIRVNYDRITSRFSLPIEADTRKQKQNQNI
jgi:hypothetical protein